MLLRHTTPHHSTSAASHSHHSAFTANQGATPTSATRAQQNFSSENSCNIQRTNTPHSLSMTQTSVFLVILLSITSTTCTAHLSQNSRLTCRTAQFLNAETRSTARGAGHMLRVFFQWLFQDAGLPQLIPGGITNAITFRFMSLVSPWPTAKTVGHNDEGVCTASIDLLADFSVVAPISAHPPISYSLPTFLTRLTAPLPSLAALSTAH